MIAPPSVAELNKRLQGRGTETDEQIENRLSRLEYELSQKDKYDFVVVNDEDLCIQHFKYLPQHYF
jgi:guanylate kinase